MYTTRVNSWTLTISDLCKRPKSSVKHIRPHNVCIRYKPFSLPPSDKILFETVNCELEKINLWFKANGSSLNVEKTNCTLFHRNSIKGKIPLKLPALQIGNKIIERTPFIKFLGVILDENLSWRDYIKTVENKLAKNGGLLYRAKQFLDETSLETIYFSYIFIFI